MFAGILCIRKDFEHTLYFQSYFYYLANQAHCHCPFVVPIRRSSLPEHRGFRMEKLGYN